MGRRGGGEAYQEEWDEEGERGEGTHGDDE